MLGHLYNSMVDVLIGAGTKEPEVRVSVDVDENDVDFGYVDEAGLFVWTGPCSWVLGGVDGVVDLDFVGHFGNTMDERADRGI
jgi:hypothetical protein